VRPAAEAPRERKSSRYAVLGTGKPVPPKPAGKRPSRRRQLPVDVAADLRSGGGREAARLELRLADASSAYERGRYADALTTLKELVRLTPGTAAIRELYGLTLYRLGRWKEAQRELRLLYEMTASVDQHPVLADCARALGRHDDVVELWAELRRAGAGSDILTEGRLVMAGSLADQGRIHEAIELLEPGVNRELRKPLERHIRQWYALGDLYERSGDVPRARELFRRVVTADPDLTDALERLTALA
jgi:tetratricopeptide (TPR) repeat protein